MLNKTWMTSEFKRNIFIFSTYSETFCHPKTQLPNEKLMNTSCRPCFIFNIQIWAKMMEATFICASVRSYKNLQIDTDAVLKSVHGEKRLLHRLLEVWQINIYVYCKYLHSCNFRRNHFLTLLQLRRLCHVIYCHVGKKYPCLAQWSRSVLSNPQWI